MSIADDVLGRYASSTDRSASSPSYVRSRDDDDEFVNSILSKYTQETSQPEEGIFSKGLHAVGSVLGAPKAGIDYLARAGARAQGLNVPDDATTGGMLRNALGFNQGYETSGYGSRLGGKALEFGTDLLTDPTTYALGSVSKPIATAAGAAFTGLMAGSALQEGSHTLEDYRKEGFTPKVAEEAFGTALSGGGAILGAKHMASGHAVPEIDAVRRNVAGEVNPENLSARLDYYEKRGQTDFADIVRSEMERRKGTPKPTVPLETPEGQDVGLRAAEAQAEPTATPRTSSYPQGMNISWIDEIAKATDRHPEVDAATPEQAKAAVDAVAGPAEEAAARVVAPEPQTPPLAQIQPETRQASLSRVQELVDGGMSLEEAKQVAAKEAAPAGTKEVTVEGTRREIQVSPEQAQELADAEARYRHTVEAIQAGRLGGSIKGAGMEWAAEKRRITGQLTDKEQQAKTAFDARIRPGDTVQGPDGREYQVKSPPAYGKVKVVDANGNEFNLAHGDLTKGEQRGPVPAVTEPVSPERGVSPVAGDAEAIARGDDGNVAGPEAAAIEPPGVPAPPVDALRQPAQTGRRTRLVEPPKDAQGNRILPGQENWTPEERAMVHGTAEAEVAQVAQAQRNDPTGRRPVLGTTWSTGAKNNSLTGEWYGVSSHKRGTALEELPYGPKEMASALERDKGNPIELAIHDAVRKDERVVGALENISETVEPTGPVDTSFDPAQFEAPAPQAPAAEAIPFPSKPPNPARVAMEAEVLRQRPNLDRAMVKAVFDDVEAGKRPVEATVNALLKMDTRTGPAPFRGWEGHLFEAKDQPSSLPPEKQAALRGVVEAAPPEATDWIKESNEAARVAEEARTERQGKYDAKKAQTQAERDAAAEELGEVRYSAQPMDAPARAAEIERLKRENADALAAPLMSEGSLSPAQLGLMSKNQRAALSERQMRRMEVESRIKDLQRSDEQIAAAESKAVDKETAQKLLQIDRKIQDMHQVGTGPNGKLRPKYQREVDRLTAERDSLTPKLSAQSVQEGNVPQARATLADVQANFKGHKVEATPEGFVVSLPGGRKVVVENTGHIDMNPGALERGHGPAAVTGVSEGTQQLVGSYRRVGPDSMIQVVEKGALPHEVWHAWEEHVATPKERRIANQEFTTRAKAEGRAVGEVAADSYREYFEKRQAAEAKGESYAPKNFIERMWSRVHEFFRNAYRSIFPNVEHLQRQLYEGKPWERGVKEGEAGTGGPQYATTPPVVPPAAPATGTPPKPPSTLLDKAIEYQKAGFVSAPPSHIANVGSSMGESAVKVGESFLASGIDKMMGGPRTRFAAEGGAQIKGALKQLPAMFGTFAKGLKDVTKSEGHISKKAGGGIIRAPFELLGLEDKATSEVTKGAVAHQFAAREARQKQWTPAQEEARAAELIQNPTEEVQREVSRRQFKGGKLEGEKHDPDSMIGNLVKLREKHKWLHFVMPFIETPGNIAKIAVERSPAGYVQAARAYRAYKAAVAKGATPDTISNLKGEAVDSIAKATMGTMMLGGFAAYAKAGGMTGSGPSDPKLKSQKLNTGWQPYSFVVPIGGGKYAYVPFNRFEPVSTVLGFAADLAEMKDQKTGEEMASKALGSLVSNFSSKTYLRGLADAAEFVNNPVQMGSKYLSSMAGTVVPNIVVRAATAIDPNLRDTTPKAKGLAGIPEKIGNTLLSRVPGASTLLPERKSSTGEPVERAGSMLSRFLSPVQISEDKGNAELERTLGEIGYAPSQPSRKIKIPGSDTHVQLSDSEYKVMQESNKSAAEYLRSNLDRIKRLPKEEQESAIKKVFDRARESARNRLFASPSFRARAKSEVANARQS